VCKLNSFGRSCTAACKKYSARCVLTLSPQIVDFEVGHSIFSEVCGRIDCKLICADDSEATVFLERWSTRGCCQYPRTVEELADMIENHFLGFFSALQRRQQGRDATCGQNGPIPNNIFPMLFEEEEYWLSWCHYATTKQTSRVCLRYQNSLVTCVKLSSIE
jgi:hypothetical protein